MPFPVPVENVVSQTYLTWTDWTAGDLVQRFGPIPLARIVIPPGPGPAVEGDVVALNDRENRLCELVDGVLVEKTAGTFESYLAALLGYFVGSHVRANNLGIVLGADGMFRLAPGLVRIPDVAFISWSRLPGGQVPRDAIARVVPDLAIEIISKGNTREEMDRKLDEYFKAGVRLVWYVYPEGNRAVIYTARNQSREIGPGDTLDGGDILPGFSLAIDELFKVTQPPPA